MEYQKRLKHFEISSDTAGQLTFSNPTTVPGSVRLAMSPTGTAVILTQQVPRPDADPEYPIGVGYRVSLPTFIVPGVHQWLLAQFETTLVENPTVDPREVTGVRARAHDGTDEYKWTAGAWAVVGDEDADWNTLEEVAHGLVDWDPELPLGLTFELQTTDRGYTPAIHGVTLMYDIDLPDEFNDWVYGAIVGGLASIRPVKDIEILSDGASSIDFAEIEGGLEVWKNGSESLFDEVVSVFNQTADPYHRTDLFVAFNSGTRAVTLSGSPPIDDVLLLRVTYRPVIAVTTDQDYLELASTPAIIIEDLTQVDLGEAPTDRHIMDEYATPPVATVFPAPRRTNIDVGLVITAPLTVDLNRIGTEVQNFLNARRVLASPMTGDEVSMRIVDDRDPTTGPDRVGVRTASMLFRLEDVYFQTRPPVQGGTGGVNAYGVTSVQVGSQAGSALSTTEIT